MSSPVKNVLVLGASGSIGPSIVAALLSAKFNVAALTRETSTASFPETVRVIKTNYTEASLLIAFNGQDAIVSAIATFSTHIQAAIISAATKAGVMRFIPSEYGVDTSLPTIKDTLPFALPKQETVQCLKSHEKEGLSWTAVIVGGFFDWSFQYPGLFGWDVPGKKATIFDGGDGEYEVTNIAQIGRAVAAVLSSEHYEETRNKYVYVNSFTVTQNKILRALERLTGENFEIEHDSVKELASAGLEKAKVSAKLTPSAQYIDGSVEVITAAIYGNGGFNSFSKTRCLWNDKLGLPREDFEETMVRVVNSQV